MAVYWSPAGVCDVCGCLYMDAFDYCCLGCHVPFYDSVREFLDMEGCADEEAEERALVDFIEIGSDSEDEGLASVGPRRSSFLDSSEEGEEEEGVDIVEDKCLCCNVCDYVDDLCDSKCSFEGDCMYCDVCLSLLERDGDSEDGVHVDLVCVECGQARTKVHVKDALRMCGICCALYL